MPHWIVLGDIHGKTEAARFLPEIETAEGIIVSGDLTQFGGPKDAAKVLAELRVKNRVISALPGNLDNAGVAELLDAEGLNSHGACKRIEAADGQAFYLIGLGGSNITPFKTPTEFPEDVLAARLVEAYTQYLAQNHKDPRPLLLCSHTPPLNTACDKISAGVHVGSAAVRNFIEKSQPALCICGHIHESAASDMIGATPVINPGAFMQGGYVRLALQDGMFKARAHNIEETNRGK